MIFIFRVSCRTDDNGKVYFGRHGDPAVLSQVGNLIRLKKIFIMTDTLMILLMKK